MQSSVWVVTLPADLDRLVEVYVNGVPKQEGNDYNVQGHRLTFECRLAKEGRLGPMRWLSMLLGIAGTYRQNDSVDVIYVSVDGKRQMANDLKFVEVALALASELN